MLTATANLKTALAQRYRIERELEAALGNKQSALEWCRKAMDMRDPQFVIFAVGWPVTDELRAMPEHGAMLQEIKLPGVMHD